MGAWSVQVFDNDDAMDFVAELQESSSLNVVTTAFQAISPGKYLEAPECSVALAAAEVVAALKGRPAKSLPKEVVVWVRKASVKPDSKLLGLAQMAVHRIATDSELKELWDESKERAAWVAVVKDLETRLGVA